MRLFIKILGIILILAIIVFVGKDYIVNGYVNDLLRKEFQKGSLVEKTSIWLNDVEFKSVSILGEGFKFTADRIILDTKYTDSFKPEIVGITVKDARLKVYNFKSLKDTISKKTVRFAAGIKKEESVEKIKTFKVNLDDIEIQTDKEGLVPFGANFSFQGDVSGQRITGIKNIDIDRCTLQAYKKKLSFELHKNKGNAYTLKIIQLKAEDAELEDVSIDLSLGPEKVLVSNLRTDLFGESASIEGVIDYKDYANICAFFVLKEVSLNRAKNFFIDKDKVLFQGGFDGKIKFCFKEKKVSGIDVNLYNNTGGRIDVKEKKAVSFLRKRMDEASYNTLMNSLQDYKYNRGKMKISQENDLVIVDMFFSSPVSGERNLTVNFHDFIGVSN